MRNCRFAAFNWVNTMARSREQKKKIIEDIKEKLDKQKAIVFVEVKGLKAKEIFDLREKLKKADSLLTIAKKTLLDIAFKERKLKVKGKKLEGQVALVFGFSDEIKPARITHQFSLSNGNLKILGGIFEDKFIDSDQIIALAQLSSKEELYTRVVRTIVSPISGFVNVLQANIKGLIYTLKQIKA